jgi:hypothetical protein
MSQAGSKLGGLPDLQYGPVVVQPAPVATSSHAGAAWTALADAAEDIGKRFQPALDEIAARKGSESIQRDAQGNLIAPAEHTVFTEADKAYENAAHLKYMNEAALDLQPKISDLQAKYANDPQGFKTGLDALITGATKNAPPQFQGPITSMLLESGQAAQSTLLRQKQARDVNASLQTTDAAIEADRNALHGFARSGSLDDPQAQLAITRMTANIRAKAGNPLFNYAPAQAEQDISELQSQLKGESILGHVDDMYTRLGEKGAIAESEKLLDDPALNISPQERNQLSAQARQRIREMHAGTINEQQELQRQIEFRQDDALSAALATGKWTDVLSPDDITRAYAGNPQRAAQLIGRLNAGAEIYSMRKEVTMASPARLAELEAKYNPEKSGAADVPAGFNSVWSKFTAPHEGGFSAHDGGQQPPMYLAGPKPEGMTEQGNIDLNARPVVKNKDGSISTVRSITVEDGKGAVLIPTVIGNKVVSNAEAIAYYKKTGENLGKFTTEKQADAYAQGLHEQQAKAYGSPVNMGINQGANPDIDVKNLTPAQAAQIAKDRYWTPSGADALPPALAAVQFDTAFNMGVPAAKDLLQQSGGDVPTYLKLREQHYRDIAKDPTKAANLPNWLQRNADLSNFVSGGDIANKVREYGAFQEAVAHRQQALKDDPAGYVLGARPDISQQLSSKDPATVQNGVRSLLAVQRDIGAPTSDVLSKGAAQVIINEFNNPADPEHRAQGMNDVIEAMAQRYGSYFPQVMTELTRKGMPDEAYALLLTRGDPGTATRMANAINNRKALDKLMDGNPDKKDVDQGVTSALADLSKTVSAQGDGPATMARLTSAARVYAYQLVQEGVPAGKAAETAAHDVISQHYTVQGSYRVPKGIDADAVSSGASDFQAKIGDKDLMPMGTFASPTASAETKQQMTAQIARRKAIWVTTPDEGGLQLVWPMELGYAPVRDAKGAPIRRTWGQLQSGNKGVQAPPEGAGWDTILKGLN